MLFFITWLIAMGTSELLLWPYGYLHLMSTILYISLSIMFIYQRRKIYKNKDHNFYEKKIAAMRSGIMFVVAMLVMLAITVNIRFFTLIYTGF